MIVLENRSMLQHEIEIDQANAKMRSLKIKRWLRSDEVALYLGSTREAIKKLYQRGNLSANKFCGRLYFDREQLDLLIENSATRIGPGISRTGMQIPKPRRL